MSFHDTCCLLIKSDKASKVNDNFWFCELGTYGASYHFKEMTLRQNFRADDDSNGRQKSQ